MIICALCRDQWGTLVCSYSAFRGHSWSSELKWIDWVPVKTQLRFICLQQCTTVTYTVQTIYNGGLPTCQRGEPIYAGQCHQLLEHDCHKEKK